jgi:purine-nucleoside phosphorylase
MSVQELRFMGRLSKAIFGRERLPERCILYGGAYEPSRKDVVRKVFDKWDRIRGTWIKYTYARSRGTEYLIVFNVYGGALVLDLLHLLRDGKTKKVFFIGSMYAKELALGTIVIPVKVVDKAGLVLLDSPDSRTTGPDTSHLSNLERAMEARKAKFVKAKVASVPAALHDIGHIKDFINEDESVAGVEMEVSTFYHFSRKLGLESYALLYVSDNKKYGLTSKAQEVWKARKEALRDTTRVALVVLGK